MALDGIITDMDALEMGIFTNERLARGTPVLLEIEGKLKGKLQAKVVSCRMIPLSSHVIKTDENRTEIWRLRIRAIIGGEDEAKFPKELLDALMKDEKD